MTSVTERALQLDWHLPPTELHTQLLRQLAPAEAAVRCCYAPAASEVAVVPHSIPQQTPFVFKPRGEETQDEFIVALCVPTGIGAHTGGHAGDATPVLLALAELADQVITHPNVVNASDINELPTNALYVEGSMLSSFLMGTVGLLPRRSNRVLVVIGNHTDQRYVDAAINAANAARATYGLNVSAIELVPLEMEASWSETGRASGVAANLAPLLQLLEQQQGAYDAVALTSAITIAPAVRDHYLITNSDSVNPWGGVEALLTHAISLSTGVPTAHAPMMPSQDVEELDYGVVDARVAAEMISFTFFQCVLKGLQRAPVAVAPDTTGSVTTRNVNALVIPKGCFGLPHYAALHQGIPVIAVEDSIASPDYSEFVRSLPWQPGQYREVANYHEALGVLACLKAGITPESVSRPLETIGARLAQEYIAKSN